jgi:Hydrolytic ATP binding site of dynein motor region
VQVLDLIHNIDVLDQLVAERTSSLADWAWSKQLRYYSQAGTARSTTAAPVVTVKMAEATLHYSWEYQGNAPKLVYTPLTDKCYLTLTQVSPVVCYHHPLSNIRTEFVDAAIAHILTSLCAGLEVLQTVCILQAVNAEAPGPPPV